MMCARYTEVDKQPHVMLTLDGLGDMHPAPTSFLLSSAEVVQLVEILRAALL